MKKFLVIGNPIKHSLSPQLHNFWFKENNINAIYESLKLDSNQLDQLIKNLKEKKIDGVNITVPFKKEIISYLDKLSEEALAVQSVNTICLEDNKLVGYNTDIVGFELSIKETKFDLKNKNIFILGAGGVVPSIIYSLNKMNVSKIFISNRTKTKAEYLKKFYKNLTVLDWGEVPDFDMIINATSIGLNKNEKIDINFITMKNKFFYDVIYNPKETNFLQVGKKLGNKTLNGKMMFIYQASAAFNLWHKINPEINEKTIKILD